MIIPLHFAQVNLLWGGVGYPRGAQTTFGVDNSATSLTAAAIGGAVNLSVVGDIMPDFSSQLAYLGCLVKLGPNNTGHAEVVPTSASGGNAAQALPPNVSMLVHKNTALGGRHGRGRFNWPGVREDLTDGAGLLSAAAVTAYQEDMQDLLDVLTATAIPMVLLHADATAPTLVTGLTVMNQLATVRRRLRK